MASTVYTYTLKTVECGQCGAPVSGTIAGGQVRCDYCGATMQVSARPRESGREHVVTEIDESARLAGLRAQVDSFDSNITSRSTTSR